MKTLAFASRNAKEIIRDKVNLIFGIAFPIVLLCLLTLLQSNIPIKQFPIHTLAPGITIFGLSFIALFSGFLLAKDRASSFMMRLMSSPMKSHNFILGYIIPLIPIAIVQSTVCFLVAMLLGLAWTPNILLAILTNIPATFIFISIGLICGTFFTDKQVGALCGALLTNVCAWLSGIWFDVALVGGIFETLANGLPFLHAVNVGKHMLAGNIEQMLPDLLWVITYAIILTILAIILFTNKMKENT